MSLDASGTVGKTATFSKWKGRNYVRVRVTPRNPQTENQAAVRTKLGALGQALSAVLTAFDAGATLGSPFYTTAVEFALAGQSWISSAMKRIIGTDFGAFDAAITAYDGLSSPDKGLYEDEAAIMGLTSFSLPYGTAPAVVGGAQVYLMLKYAIEFLGYTLSAGSLDDPDAGGLADFGDWVTQETP